MQVFSEPLRVGANHFPALMRQLHGEDVPQCEVFSAVAIFGDDAGQTDALSAACADLELVPLMGSNGWSPSGVPEHPAPLLALIQGRVADEAAVSLAQACRERGMCRIVLVGPEFGSVDAQTALLRGFDEVWPRQLPHGLGVVILQKAWQTAKRLGAIDGARLLRVGPLSIGKGDDSFAYRNRKVNLGGDSVALLRVLATHFPKPVSRGALMRALRKTELDLAANTRIVDMSVMRLRQRLRAAGVRGVNISTVRGVGYGLELDGSSA